ncbi:MAG TPA: hypothetical protein VEU50_14255, partial [Archangium sp.]|nr:hypothetical protein [Archangium sp.]
MNEEGELLSGQLWAEMEVTPQTGRKDAASDQFRRLYRELARIIHQGGPEEPEPVGAGTRSSGSGLGGTLLARSHPSREDMTYLV